jgi:hypothetical protein
VAEQRRARSCWLVGEEGGFLIDFEKSREEVLLDEATQNVGEETVRWRCNYSDPRSVNFLSRDQRI